ncbi:MAG: 30S ribosomal protein S19 [candidate division WS6 bacterium GW2011_GWF2_39_15]|uniref:Small ribosomal subunit protein uS19 n=1 Tax=candidate division WS6 bacterium GW2011_GWF2_39_15 TaxID=1619100 RepID=A0A0G0Q5G4_9BACT|nr:MAG: 30S ribosomal protein S19 [candidate division WS6 bacterium GW2011_GWF2_39_15]
MSRSLKKGAYTDVKLMEKVRKAIASGARSPIKTWARSSMITPEMVGLTFGVHNGKKHENVLVQESMVGHKLGEFSPTRTFRGHAKKGKLSKVYGSSGRFEEGSKA